MSDRFPFEFGDPQEFPLAQFHREVTTRVMWVWFLCILGFLKHPKVIDIELNQKLCACTSNFQPSLQLMKK